MSKQKRVRSIQSANNYSTEQKKRLKDLTVKWYSKLAKSGFEDIEWFNPETGNGQNSDYIYRPTFNLAKKYNESTRQHYVICSTFAAYNALDYKYHDKLWSWYCEGLSYRDIIAKYNATYRPKTSNYQNIGLLKLHILITRWIKQAYHWNRNHPEGVLYDKWEDPESDF